jgi:hypothetical protein
MNATTAKFVRTLAAICEANQSETPAAEPAAVDAAAA